MSLIGTSGRLPPTLIHVLPRLVVRKTPTSVAMMSHFACAHGRMTSLTGACGTADSRCRGRQLFLRALFFGMRVGRDRCADQRLERGCVDLVPLADIDGASGVPLEARVEEPGRVLRRRPLEEGQLDDGLVGLAGADPAVVRPDGSSGARGFPPLPLFDDFRVSLLDELAHPAQG